MISAAFTLQKAVFEALSADEALTAAMGGKGRLFDGAPYNQDFPFITFGEITSSDWSTGTEAGEDHSLTLHVWSRAGGKKQVFQAAAVIYGLLHDASLQLSGFKLIGLRHQATTVRLGTDGETFHAALRFRAVTEAAN
jgi:hypothetical protein